ATTQAPTLPLHDALPIWGTPAGADAWNASATGALRKPRRSCSCRATVVRSMFPSSDHRQVDLGLVALERVQLTLGRLRSAEPRLDRKSTRLNSSHDQISY